jgi:hypothetical protein
MPAATSLNMVAAGCKSSNKLPVVAMISDTLDRYNRIGLKERSDARSGSDQISRGLRSFSDLTVGRVVVTRLKAAGRMLLEVNST